MSWTKEQQKEHRKLWIDALRSGNYTQGIGCLKTNENEYCCLGVACEVAIQKGLNVTAETSNLFNKIMFDGITGVMPLTVMDYYGLVDDCGAYSKTDSLVNDNDTKKLSFTEIANIIESEPKGLFFND